MTMTSNYCMTFLLVIISAYSAMSQDCSVPGRYCIDDASCCGGCCRNNVCIQTYDSCMVHDDKCLQHYCPPGLECYIYQPNCIGCEPVADCRDQKRYKPKGKGGRITKLSQTISFGRNF